MLIAQCRFRQKWVEELADNLTTDIPLPVVGPHYVPPGWTFHYPVHRIWNFGALWDKIGFLAILGESTY